MSAMEVLRIVVVISSVILLISLAFLFAVLHEVGSIVLPWERGKRG